MGQYWIVACPEREEQLSSLVNGKLGEILPGGYAGRHLQQRLMVPRFAQYADPIRQGGGANYDAERSFYKYPPDQSRRTLI